MGRISGPEGLHDVFRTLVTLGVTVLCLLMTGFTVLFSAGQTNGLRLHDDAYYFVTHQAASLLIGVMLFAIVAFFDYRKWRQYRWLTIAAYVATAAMMVAVFFFPAVNGSHRWIRLMGMRLQPSEFAKIVAVLATAVFVDRAGWRIERFWRGSFLAMLIVAGLMVLAVAEPDFGSAFVIAVTCFMLFVVAGMKLLHFILMGSVGLAGVGVLVYHNPNRMARIAAWLPDWMSSLLGLPPAAEDDAAAYQLTQAIIAIRRGGIGGVGFFKSSQKYEYLPESHTDFIFAIGAEEWGIWFSMLLVVLYTIVLVCGVMIAARAQDRFGRLVAYGATILIAFQAFFNMGVVTGMLPTKGLALPFISYGGTNLMTAMIAVGLLFSVGRRIELPKPRPRSTISPGFA